MEKDTHPAAAAYEVQPAGHAGMGLTENEAARLLEQFGPNELQEKGVNPLLQFLSYFWGPIPAMIEVAAVLSGLLRHWADFGIVLVLLVVNAVIGFWEEHQAGNTIAALKKKLALSAKVRRDGVWKSVPARELVPGDVMRVRIGDIIAADARLLEGDPLQIDQSALTGESLPVSRGPGEILYSGAVVKQGESEAVVTATGRQTYFGKTANLVQQGHTVSRFQRVVLKIGNYLIGLAVLLVLVILAVATIRGDDLLTTVEFALILTVAAIPVAMPTVLSVTMAVGARALAKKQAIVTHLVSIEELAGMDVLCSDKTGTLTQNKLSVGEPFLAAGVTRQDLLEAAALASREEDQDPIDLAVLEGAADLGENSKYRILHFAPFDPVRKRTEAKVADETGRYFLVSKGAPQVIEQLTGGSPAGTNEAIMEFASRGFRSLAVAKTGGDGRWQFLGVIPLFDPVRPDSREVLATARSLGIKVKMVTGDQLPIAREVARQLGLGDRIQDTGMFTDSSRGTGQDLGELIENSDGYAQVFPEHKYRIVEELQRRGHIVGMTGDGVNDAPALKKAEVGVAVSGATDAARAAADIVLLDPGLGVIIEAVQESRRIFQRMVSYATYRITETIRVLLFMTLSILVFNFYPVTAVMIILLALLNDGAILSIAYDNVPFANHPEQWELKELLTLATVLGVSGVCASFLLFFIGERTWHLSREFIQTLMYLKLSVAGHLTVFVTRTRQPFWRSRPSHLLLGAVVGTQILATLIAVYGVFMPPLGWGWAAVVWSYSLFWFVVNDAIKRGTCQWLEWRSRATVAVG